MGLIFIFKLLFFLGIFAACAYGLNALYNALAGDDEKKNSCSFDPCYCCAKGDQLTFDCDPGCGSSGGARGVRVDFDRCVKADAISETCVSGGNSINLG